MDPGLLILFLLMGALYVFMILPQQRRMRAHQELLRSLREGDVVVTNSGIHGAIAEVEDQVVWLEVAPEVEHRIVAEVLLFLAWGAAGAAGLLAVKAAVALCKDVGRTVATPSEAAKILRLPR